MCARPRESLILPAADILATNSLARNAQGRSMQALAKDVQATGPAHRRVYASAAKGSTGRGASRASQGIMEVPVPRALIVVPMANVQVLGRRKAVESVSATMGITARHATSAIGATLWGVMVSATNAQNISAALATFPVESVRSTRPAMQANAGASLTL